MIKAKQNKPELLFIEISLKSLTNRADDYLLIRECHYCKNIVNLNNKHYYIKYKILIKCYDLINHSFLTLCEGDD